MPRRVGCGKSVPLKALTYGSDGQPYLFIFMLLRLAATPPDSTDHSPGCLRLPPMVHDGRSGLRVAVSMRGGLSPSVGDHGLKFTDLRLSSLITLPAGVRGGRR